MSKLTDEQKILIVFTHTKLNPNQADDREFLQMVMGAVNAIEAAATEPLLQRIAELERQLEEARKDAERYRWLVAQMMHPDQDHQEEMFNRLHAINPDPANAKEVDAAIDAAMQKGQS